MELNIRKLSACLFLAVAVVAGHAWAESIYVVRGAGKSLLITNRKPASGRVIANYNFKPRARVWFSNKSCGIRVTNYERLIHHEASINRVDPALVKAVVHAESAFNPCARSPKGAIGLMQLMPTTARLLGVMNPWEPSQNIRGGVKYLAQLLDRYDGNIALSLAAYNAGPGAVRQHGGVPPYMETRQYVRRVMDLRERYRRS